MRTEVRSLKVSRDLTSGSIKQIQQRGIRIGYGNAVSMLANADCGKIEKEAKKLHKHKPHGMSAQEFKQRMLHDHKRIIKEAVQ